MTRRPTRRAVALLLVLVTLVVAVTAAANVARVSVTGLAAESLADRRRVADDLLRQGEQIAASWLQRESPSALVPVDAPSPTLSVAHDVVIFGGLRAEIGIQAIDLTGMLPLEALRQGSELRGAIPADVLETIGALGNAKILNAPDQLVKSRRAVFPEPVRDEPVCFEAGPTTTDPRLGDPSGSFGGHSCRGGPAITELVAFLRPAPPRRRHQPEAEPVILNVNTTPVPLLARAFATAGLDVLDRVVEARERGEPASVELAANDGAMVRFTTRSTLWAFRCDARVGGVTRSWWSVFEQEAGSWRLVRRIVIDA